MVVAAASSPHNLTWPSHVTASDVQQVCFAGVGGRCLDTSGLLAPGKLLLVAALTFEAREPLTFHGLCLSYRVTYVRLTESSQVAAGVTGVGLLGHPGNVYSKVIILLTGWFINRK